MINSAHTCCAHLIVQLPPLSLLSTALDLFLNQTGVLKVLCLSVELYSWKRNDE